MTTIINPDCYKEPVISEDNLLDLLPHGSGIDASWEIDTHKNGNITAKNSFHSMNDTGMYDGWMNFTVRIFRVKKNKLNKLKGPSEGKYQIVAKKGDIDFTVSCCESRKASFYDLKNYLNDTLDTHLESIVTQLRYESIDESEIDKWL